MTSSFSASSDHFDNGDFTDSLSSRRQGSGGRSRCRGARGRGVRAAASRADLEQRVEECHQQRMAATLRLLQELRPEDLLSLSIRLLERQPGLMFDALMMHQHIHGTPQFGGLPGVPWCTCLNCREMPTDRERQCCGQEPANCITTLPHFSQYCLDEGYLRIHRQYREAVTVLGRAREPGDDNPEYRYATYRHYIYWQHGSLGSGNRLVIPSCCVWRIRDKFPDPHGHYTGFVPGY